MGIANKKIKLAALLGAIVMVLGGLWLYAEQLDDEHQSLVADRVEVVKAARNMPRGTPLTKDRVTTEAVPRKFLPPNPLLESELNIYLGVPVAHNVEEGAMVLTSDFSVVEVSRPHAGSLVSALVIKTAVLALEAESPVSTGNAVLETIGRVGGYIVSSDSHATRESQSFSMTARVPAAEFERTVAELDGLGVAVERRIRGAGVTGDVARLERQIGNADFKIEGLRHARTQKKRKRETTKIEIMNMNGEVFESKRTTTVDPGSEDHKELADAELERAELENDLTELRAETALSTIELTISQPRVEYVPPPEPTFVELLVADLERSTRALVGGLTATVRLFAKLLPFLVLGGPFGALALYWRRRRRLAA